MDSRPCLKCGHVAEGPGELPDACPICGAVYARVEAALGRGEIIDRVRPEVLAAGSERGELAPSKRPGTVLSLAIGLGFSLTLLALLAGIAVFGMIMSGVSDIMIGAPGAGQARAWSTGFETFVGSLIAGWAFAAVTSMTLSLLRRPVAGLFAGVACGVLAGLIFGFMLR